MLYWITQNKTKVPKLGFGTWLMQRSNCVKAIRTALDIGYRHIDTAQIYDNESDIGKAITMSNISRDKIFLVTKIWRNNLDTQNVYSSTTQSLKKLNTDYVDLLLIHWPNSQIPLKHTLLALQNLITQNKTRFIGVSNFPVKLIKIAKKIAPNIICNQVEYHPFLNQKALLKSMKQQNMFLTAYSPLARNKILKNKIIQQIGEKYSKTAGQIVLRWLIEQKNVVAIPKAAQQKHAESNFDIFDFKLQEQDKLILNNIHSQKNQINRLVNPEWAPQWD